MRCRLDDLVLETPVQGLPALSARLGVDIRVKREDLQPVFSFKLRGAYAKLQALSDADRVRGVICASVEFHGGSESTALGVIEEKVRSIDVEEVIRMGHQVADCKALVEEFSIDLVVMNTKDEEQLAMHGLAYPLAIELRSVPLLML